jgi:hypothetical protein
MRSVDRLAWKDLIVSPNEVGCTLTEPNLSARECASLVG